MNTVKLTRKEVEALGFDDWRDFVEALGRWSYNHDWTYQAPEKKSLNDVVQLFIKDLNS